MKIQYLLFLTTIFLSCITKEKGFENKYLSISTPADWIITEKNNESEARWLVTVLVPKNSKYYDDSNEESPSQNLIIIAKDSTEVSIDGYEDFNAYAQNFYQHQKLQYSKVSKFQTVTLSTKKSYYWDRTIEELNKESLIQKIYLVKTKGLYLSFLVTHRLKGKATDTEKILSSIKFK